VTEHDDHLSHVPSGSVPSSQAGARLLDLVRVMARLRAPDGCPWDREQTHASLARHLLEETHEVLDAIDADDRERLREELGDVLLQVAFHAQLAADDGAWDVDDVAQGIVEKLIRRHPHVFGDVEVSGADEVLVNWERIKAGEKGHKPIEDDIPASLPALARASKVQRRTAGWGFEWRSAGSAIQALKEEVGELESHTDADNAEEEIGGGSASTRRARSAGRSGVSPNATSSSPRYSRSGVSGSTTCPRTRSGRCSARPVRDRTARTIGRDAPRTTVPRQRV
jgi:tetrapyrrole methylase family protein / MazG family protein